jgi:peptidoglycan/LPS O-acetylase OafA/YrhL
MKLPAVAIAAAFSGGILLGLAPWFRLHSGTHTALAMLIFGIALLIVLGYLLVRCEFVWASAMVCLAAWVALGVLASTVANRPLTPDHVLSRLSAQEIPQHTPLRWYGTLASEPARIPRRGGCANFYCFCR